LSIDLRIFGDSADVSKIALRTDLADEIFFDTPTAFAVTLHYCTQRNKLYQSPKVSGTEVRLPSETKVNKEIFQLG